jgi:hypothetical protein
LPEDTGFNGEDYTMTQYQDNAQNPEGEQFYPEENPEVGIEPEHTWDPYQT